MEDTAVFNGRGFISQPNIVAIEGSNMPASIVTLPETFLKFFMALQISFSKPQRRHFGVYMMGSIVCQEKHTLRALSEAVIESGAACNLYRFVAISPWSMSDLEKRRWQLVLDTLPEYPEGTYCFLIIDDSICAKTGKKMEAAGWFKGDDGKKHEFGHDVVTSHCVIGEQEFPVGLKPYFKEVWCQETKTRFYTRNELAAQLIREFKPPEGVKVIVLFDAWYLNPTVIKAVKERKFNWISRAKSNRVFHEGQEKENLSTLAKKLDRQNLPKVQVSGSSYLVYSCNLSLNTLGNTRVLVTFDAEKPDKRPVFLATDMIKLSARQVLEFYTVRWRIETFYRDVKQLLGFSDYQMRKARAQKRHWQLVLTAYTLLRLQQFTEAGSLTESPQTLGEQCRSLRQHNNEELIRLICQQSSQGKSPESICRSLRLAA